MTATTSAPPRSSAGSLLRLWRQRRRLSQLDLAVGAGVSTRHLSFVETGRAQASRALISHLAGYLDVPLRERNRMLLAAGYAPAYPEYDYHEPAMDSLRTALSAVLAAHEPHPTLIVDRLWNVVEANQAAALLTEGVDPELLTPPINALRLGFHPNGLPRIATASSADNLGFLRRLRRVAEENADAELLALLTEIDRYRPSGGQNAVALDDGEPLATVELHTKVGEVRLFTIIATLGAPVEVTSSALAIESFLPADEDSAAKLRALADLRGR
ncbi:MAG TPA: helix-turn-helix transcriptional regulator [Pseudonocardia sp.]|nr:helix-turn-helix transcriptional regulator [Pseudonocardia sp.]